MKCNNDVSLKQLT